MQGLLKILFIITLLELFLGGGGRVFEFGGIPLRMLLFILNIILIGVLYVYKSSIPQYVVILSLAILGILLVYAVLGLINGAALPLILEDVKPLSYFFSVIFFSYYINSMKRVSLIVSLVKKSSLFLALVYVGIQALFYLGKIDFQAFYYYMNTHVSPSDFFFRGTQGLFFYKGFLYMVVGLIFWIHDRKKKWRGVAIVTIMIAMVLTGTRGFILTFAFLYALFFGIPYLLKLNTKFLILAFVLIIGSIYFFGNINLGDKELSNSIRVQQLVQVIERVNPISFVVGHGFGIGVPIREVHMEIGYLEVFHKQGVLGLSLWAIFFIILYNKYIKMKNFIYLRKAFFLSVLFVILLSFTNPFFNNPIGISLFMISLCSLTVMNKIGQNPALHTAMDKSVL